MTNLQHTIEGYETTLSYFCANEKVIGILDSGNISKPAQTALYQNMYTLLAGRSGSVVMHVMKSDGTFNLSTGVLPEIYNVKSHYYWGIFRELNKNPGIILYPNHYTSAAGRVYSMSIAGSIKKDGKIIGYSMIDIPEDVLQEVLASSNTLQPVFYTLIDENYYILYDHIFNTGDIFLGENLRSTLSSSEPARYFYLEDPKRLITWDVMEYKLPLTVISSVPVDLVVMNNSYIAITTVIIVIATILLCLGLSPIVVSNLTRPLKEIVEVMQKVQQGDASARVSVRKDDEFGFIASNFNMTLDKLSTLYETNLEKQNRLRLSELKALHAQINPHFLYNTLDSIKWLAKLNGVNDIVTMVSQLGRLLKSSINNRNNYVQIQEEINLVKSYLSIQQIRYGDKFEAEICVDESIMQCVVPKFIIQPLVENAIIHGIESKLGNAKLIIKGAKKDDKVIFEIIDDGVGISEENLAKLKQSAMDSDADKESIGIENVDKRIKLYYGPEYGLDIESEENVGTTTRITMPFNEVME
jgi:two-component system sensor histidine kinase YesM